MASKTSKDENSGSQKSFGKVIGKFVDKTSMQGVVYIKDSKTITAKVVWSFLLICALVVMSLHLYLLVSTFVAWPKKTTLSLGFNNLKLPSVTVCNVNVFQYSKRDQTSQQLLNLLQKVNPKNFDKSKSVTGGTIDPGNNGDTDTSATADPDDKNDSWDIDTGTTADPADKENTDIGTTADAGDNGDIGTSTTADPGDNGHIGTSTTAVPGDNGDIGTSTTAVPGDNGDKGTMTTAEPGNNGDIGTMTTADLGDNGNIGSLTTADPGDNGDIGTTTTADPGDNGGIGIMTIADPGDNGGIGTMTTADPDDNGDIGLSTTANPSDNGHIGTSTTVDLGDNGDTDKGATADPDYEEDTDTDDDTDNGDIDKRRKKRYLDDVDDVVNDTVDEYKNKNKGYDDEIEITGAHDAIFVIHEQFTDYFLDLDRKTRIAIGHDMERMLVRCNFKGIQCFAENFTVSQDPNYGNCFTLDSSKLVVKKAGPSYGLTLVLYLRTHEYLPGITTGYGARLHLHHPETLSFPSSAGTFIEASRETHIAVKQTNIHRIGDPHGKCEDGVKFKATYGKQYTRQSCQYLCKSSTMIKKCGCYDEEDDEIFHSFTGQKVKPCMETSQGDCMLNVTLRYLNKTLTCDCLEPCIETTYTSTISAREWPTDDYSVLLREAICEDIPDDCKLIRAMNKDDLRRNFLKLKVYYEDLNYESIKEEPDIEVSQFASDVGGAIGLWIGLSMLSMFEIVQLLYEILEYFFYYKLCKSSQNTDNTETNTAQTGSSFDEEKPYSSYYNGFENDRSSITKSSGKWETSPQFPSYRFYRGSS